jgi:small subunit ribosomal protein S10
VSLKETVSVPYEPKILSSEEVLETTKTPFPINVELNYYAPLRHEIRHGDLVAELQFRAYDYENLEFLGDFAQRAAYYLDIPVSGVIPLPTRRERWTVIRAPFVHAKSKENFLRLTHKRVIKAYDATPEVIDLWVSYIAKHSNSGVGVKVKTFQREPVNLAAELDKTELASIEQFKDTVGGQAAIAKRVQELLNDPVFKRHIPQEQVEKKESAEQIEDKQVN